VEALIWMYHLSGDLCGKRLQAAMPELLRAMGRHGTLLPDPLAVALLHMGSAPMDRLLRQISQDVRLETVTSKAISV
jgi:hypothetical protein